MGGGLHWGGGGRKERAWSINSRPKIFEEIVERAPIRFEATITQ